MANIFQFKPRIILLIFISLFIVSFFISVGVFELLFDIIDFAGISVLGLGFMIPFTIWIIYVGYAIEKKDRDKNNQSRFKIFIFFVVLFTICSILSMLLYDYSLFKKQNLPEIINITFGLIRTSGLLYIVHYLTLGFTKYYYKRATQFWDYMGYMFLLGFLPFGIYIIQKQINAISDKEIKKQNK